MAGARRGYRRKDLSQFAAVDAGKTPGGNHEPADLPFPWRRLPAVTGLARDMPIVFLLAGWQVDRSRIYIILFASTPTSRPPPVTKGFGIVSSQAITSGSKIVSETPLVIVPEQFTQNAILSQLQQLGPEQRASFFTLKNTFTNLQPVEGIVKTNAMPLGKGSARGAIFPICSLFNHSCTANAAYHWNDDIGEEKVFALKNIEHGEEVTVSYLSDEDWTLPSKERKAKIAQEYGFDCRCIRCACEDAVEQEKSDKRRTRLGSIDKSIGNGIMITTNPSKALSFCREALTLLEEEGESSPRMEVVFYDAFQICVAHGDLARASRFAELALEAKQSWQGDDAQGMEEMVRYVKRPESHPLASHTKRWRSEAVGCKRPSYWNSTDWLWRRTS